MVEVYYYYSVRIYFYFIQKDYHLYHFLADILSISVVYRVVKLSKSGGRGGIL